MAAVAYYFDAEKQSHPDEHIPGVPLGDIDQDTFDSFPPHVQADIAASHLYRKTNPNPTPRKARVADAPPADAPTEDQS